MKNRDVKVVGLSTALMLSGAVSAKSLQEEAASDLKKRFGHNSLIVSSKPVINDIIHSRPKQGFDKFDPRSASYSQYDKYLDDDGGEGYTEVDEYTDVDNRTRDDFKTRDDFFRGGVYYKFNLNNVNLEAVMNSMQQKARF